MLTRYYAERKIRCPGIVYYSSNLKQILAATQKPSNMIKVNYIRKTTEISNDEFVMNVDDLCNELKEDDYMYVKFVRRADRLGEYI